MVARRIKSLHHNLQEGENVIFHREHRSKKGRQPKFKSFKAQTIIKKKRIERELMGKKTLGKI